MRVNEKKKKYQHKKLKIKRCEWKYHGHLRKCVKNQLILVCFCLALEQECNKWLCSVYMGNVMILLEIFPVALYRGRGRS